jgi:hypothetical protein
MDGTTVLDTETLVDGVASYTTSALSAGDHVITAAYEGNGNFNGSADHLTQTVNPGPTALWVRSSPSWSYFGQSTTFSATVLTALPGAPTGVIDFIDDTTSTDLGSVPLSNGSASLTEDGLNAGDHLVRVVYAGDANFLGSAGQTNHTVYPAFTTTSVDTSAASTVYGQAVTFTAHVSPFAPGAGTPAGMLQFRVDGADVGDPVALVDGTASAAMTSIVVGNHQITAVYAGDNNYVGSTGMLTQVVQYAGTVTALSSSGGPSVTGQAVTFTATVSAVSPSEGTPSGNVIFSDLTTNTDLGSVPVSGGAASVTVAGLGVGSHLIRAIYDGSGGNFLPSLDMVTHTVNPASTSLQVSSNNPSEPGQMVALTAVVSVMTPGTGTPTGYVDFFDQTTSRYLGSAPLIDGAANLSTSGLSVGTHVIVAGYGGNTNYQASTASVTQVVNSPPPPSSRIQGLVWEDFNDDGEVDFNERAIAGVALHLSGVDDLGQVVSQTVTTDSQGLYVFANLRPSGGSGYAIREDQPDGYADGQLALGMVNGVPTGVVGTNQFSQVNVPLPGSVGDDYNFGERPVPGAKVRSGQTASLGFWNNNRGKRLLESLNGGSSATQLGNWLAATFPNLFGASAGGSNLTGKTNAQVAAYYGPLFRETRPEKGPGKDEAEFFAVALSAYVTNQNLAGTTAVSWGFQVSAEGLGAATFDIGAANRAAFGLSPTTNTIIPVLDILLAVDARSRHGVLYDLDGSGTISKPERTLRDMANDVFTAITRRGEGCDD